MAFVEDISRAADELLGSINDAVDSGDFSHLSSDINRQLHRMQNEGAYWYWNPYMREQGGKSKKGDKGKKSHKSGGDIPEENQTAFTRKNKTVKKLKKRRERDISAIAGMTLLFVFLLIFSPQGTFALIIAIAAMGFDITRILDLRKTNGALKCGSLYDEYRKIIGNDEYITIDELCIQTRRPRNKIISEIREMMSSGYLPGAVLDEDETVLILSENAYRYYLKYEKEHSQEKEKEKAEEAEEQSLSPEAREIIEQGEKYISEFHHLNDIIPDEVMSEKLDRLENMIRRIFEEARRKPEKASGLRKLLDYYLPTTQKLVQAYADTENQPDTANIGQIKKEIEDSLDMINTACEKIFDEMFTDDAWDISSDINVMKHMMEQDGLVNDSGFNSSESK